jgi:predicted DNA-binding transcriptional regulator YafY
VRADRLVSILLLLQANGKMTAGALAERLEVSPRTVHRDLEALGIAGIPVVIDRGAAGGASPIHGYRTDLTGLTEPELRALMAFGAAGPAADLGMRPALDSASRKIAVAAGESRAGHLGQRVLIDGETWRRGGAVPEHLGRVQDALWSERRLRIRYRRSAERVVERLVEPLGLVSKRGTWYLLAEVDGRRRVYRISRIEESEVLPEGFRRPPDFELEAAWTETVASFRAGVEDFPVTVRSAAMATERLTRCFEDCLPRTRPDGLVELRFASIEMAVGVLAAFGDAVEVVSPSKLRERLGAIGRQLAATYTA